MKLTLCILCIFSLNCFSGDLSDLVIKRHFIKTSKNIISRLNSNGIDNALVRRLEENIKPSNIEIVDTKLIDNRGSIVDAKGTKASLVLNRTALSQYIQNDQNLDLLYLHELFRMAEINDDGFIESLELIRKTSPKTNRQIYCNLNVPSTEMKTVYKNISAKGEISIGSGENIFIFSMYNHKAPNSRNSKLRRSALENAKQKCLKKGYDGWVQIMSLGQSVYSIKNVNGFKRNSATLKIRARCSKKKVIKIRKSIYNEMMCSKIFECEHRIHSLEDDLELSDQLLGIEHKKRKHRC